MCGIWISTPPNVLALEYRTFACISLCLPCPSPLYSQSAFRTLPTGRLPWEVSPGLAACRVPLLRGMHDCHHVRVCKYRALPLVPAVSSSVKAGTMCSCVFSAHDPPPNGLHQGQQPCSIGKRTCVLYKVVAPETKPPWEHACQVLSLASFLTGWTVPLT